MMLSIVYHSHTLSLVIRPHPTSTLFPYTTLFRSHRLGWRRVKQPDGTGLGAERRGLPVAFAFPRATKGVAFESRSEEHTSELQSLRHLVCRLLLEKKKNNTICRSRSVVLVE